jgi:alkylated DNA repair dioxygenase AlkB
MTGLLFDIPETATPDISGLRCVQDFITEDEEQALMEVIDHQPWLNDLKRRVQHYGYKYDYKARAVTDDAYLGSLPDWITPVAQKLSFKPDQTIVNEYLPGQGISAHVDCVPCFGDTIASLSLGFGAMMQFTNGDRKEEIYLEPRSLITLSGSARHDWTHAIPARKSDTVNGCKVERRRRISLTFRKVSPDGRPRFHFCRLVCGNCNKRVKPPRSWKIYCSKVCIRRFMIANWRLGSGMRTILIPMSSVMCGSLSMYVI